MPLPMTLSRAMKLTSVGNKMGENGRFHLSVLCLANRQARRGCPERRKHCHEAEDAPMHAIAGTVHGFLAGGAYSRAVMARVPRT
jgi:hypothetical protein